jgi:hypothetical protein
MCANSSHYLDVVGVAALLDVLRRPALRAQVETLGGYDAAAMGEATGVDRDAKSASG